MDSSSTITRSIAALSWIDPLTKLPEVDTFGDPGDTVSRDHILGRQDYRFANFLEVWVKVWHGTILGHGVTNQSGIYRAPSFWDIPSEEFPIQRAVEADAFRVKYTQLVGARTQSGEVIAEQLAGIFTPIGQMAAREVVEETTKCFPPIWTELELTVFGDGWYEGRLIRHSLFPSVCFYRQDLMIKTAAGQSQPYDFGHFSVRPATQPDWTKGPIDFNTLRKGSGPNHRIFAGSKEVVGASISDEELPTYTKVSYYDGNLHLDKWVTEGWGSQKDVQGAGGGGLRGNPWGIPSPKGRLGAGREIKRMPGEVPQY